MMGNSEPSRAPELQDNTDMADVKDMPSSPSTSSRSEPSNLGQGRAGYKSDGRKIELFGIGNPIEIGRKEKGPKFNKPSNRFGPF